MLFHFGAEIGQITSIKSKIIVMRTCLTACNFTNTQNGNSLEFRSQTVLNEGN